jgi:hypothetical protein
MPKWVYPLAFAFVLFLIFRDGTAAGDSAGDFAGFIVELLGAIGEFLTGLFEGAGEAGASTSQGDPSGIADNPPPLPDNVDSFTHTHGGVTHTHTIDGDHNVGN